MLKLNFELELLSNSSHAVNLHSFFESGIGEGLRPPPSSLLTNDVLRPAYISESGGDN